MTVPRVLASISIISGVVAGTVFNLPTVRSAEAVLPVPLPISAALASQRSALAQYDVSLTAFVCNSQDNTKFVASAIITADRRRLFEKLTTRRADGTEIPDYVAGFDGIYSYDGTVYGPHKALPGLYTKYLVSDASDPDRCIKTADFTFLDALGVYAPEYPIEMVRFQQITTYPDYALSCGQLISVEPDGNNLALRLVVSDRQLVALRERDIDARRQARDRSRSAAVRASIDHEIRALLRVRTITPRRSVRIVLSPAHNYGMVRREESDSAGRLIARYETTDWFCYDNRVWLPRRAHVEVFADVPNDVFQSVPFIKYDVSVNEASLAAPPRPYSLGTLPAGAQVADRTVDASRALLGHQVVYRISASGEKLRERAGELAGQLQHESRVRAIGWVLIIGLLVLAFWLWLSH